MRRHTTLACPACGTIQHAWIPDERVIMLPCDACGKALRASLDDCCVFCAYADAPCTRVQASNPMAAFG